METEVGVVAAPSAGRAGAPTAWSCGARWKAAGPPFLLTLLALALRLVRLDFQPLWWDEGYSVWFATNPLAQMVALTAQDIHPPLYYALLRLWIDIAGTAPEALRLLSVIIGSLAIPAIYLAGRRLLGGSRAGLLAALLLAVNPLHIFYSQEIRMYGLMALLSTAVISVAWRLLAGDDHRTGPPRLRTGTRVTTQSRRPHPSNAGKLSRLAEASAIPAPHSDTERPGWLPWLIYVILVTAALYTQYYAVFLPVGLTLCAAWRWRRDMRSLARWLAAQLLVVLLYLPWLLYATPKLVRYVGEKVVADADTPLGPLAYLARHLSAFVAGHLEGPLGPWWPVALLSLAPIGVGWWLMRGGKGPASRGRHCLLPLVTLLTALSLGWLIGLLYPFFPERGERLLLLALPPFVLLVAAALDALWRQRATASYLVLGLITATSAVSLAAFYTVPRYVDDDYRPLIARTVELGLPGDTVFCVYPWQAGYWHSYGSPSGPQPLLSPVQEWGSEASAALDAALGSGRVWFPAHLALGALFETRIEEHLARNAVAFLNEWHGPGTRLSAWAAVRDPEPVSIAPGEGLPLLPVTFDVPSSGAIMLAAVHAARMPVPAANTVTPIDLVWQAATTPPVLVVSVRLTDDLGQIWAQHDYEPLGQLGAVALDEAMQSDSAAEGDSLPPLTVETARAAAWSATDRLGLLIPAGTPPGRYHVQLVLRARGSSRPLDATDSGRRSLGATARLYELQVTPADRELGSERLPIAARRAATFEDGLVLLGHSTASKPTAPGELRQVSLFWQAAAQPSVNYTAFVQLLGRDASVVAGWEAPPGASHPTSLWAPDTLIRTQAALRAPATLPDGRYRLIVGLFRTSDGMRLRTVGGADYLALEDVTVRGRSHVTARPEPAYPIDALFGATARLIGYDLPQLTTDPGGSVPLTLHWQALGPTEHPYAVFVHLSDEAGETWAYGDSEPGQGAYPTPGWLSGEYLADEHAVAIPPGTPPGIYQLAVGFYNVASQERMLTADGADRVVLQTLVKVR